MKLRKQAIITLGLIFILGILSGCASSPTGKVTSDSVKITVYKSAQCGCCVGYVSALKDAGFDVTTIPTEDMGAIKQKYGVPQGKRSCHTAVVEGYFVEGHVPLEAVQKLLSEKPDLDGITLPNMPAGSPGMPGSKTETWTIYGIKDGQASEFMKI